jgi:hypothetical protein
LQRSDMLFFDIASLYLTKHIDPDLTP